MQELSDADKEELESLERLVYQTIKEELHSHEGGTVDPLRTRFLLHKARQKVFYRPTQVVCEIRRSDPALLDLDVLFSGSGPRLDAGPPPSVIPESWELEYRIWEPRWRDYPNLKTYVDQLRPFLRDWLEGRLTLVTTYAGNKAYSWTLKRGEVVLGKKRVRVFPHFAKRRTVSQHT
ncbi:MAG: hypothetical protein O6768_08360 [Planctomycetota bacterium]|nr:hypothetical protein [Planctomycetota bacterium]